MLFHIKRDEDTTSLAGNELCAPFEDTGLCSWWLNPESTSYLSPDSTSKSPFSSTHQVTRKADMVKRPDQGLRRT